MKFTIDTANKTVKVEEAINLNELLSKMMEMFPDEYFQYKIVPNYKSCDRINWNATGALVTKPNYNFVPGPNNPAPTATFEEQL